MAVLSFYLTCFFLKEKNMLEIKKRLLRSICALSLCVSITGGAAFTSYASVPAVFFAAPLAFSALLSMLGITSSSDDTYISTDALSEWGSEQISEMANYISTSHKYASTLGKLGADALKENITAWATKAGRGVIDTASDIWGAFRDWVSSLYISVNDSDVISYGGRAVGLEIKDGYYEFSFGSNNRRFRFSPYSDWGGLTTLAAGRVLVSGETYYNFFYCGFTGTKLTYGIYYDGIQSLFRVEPLVSVDGLNYFIILLSYSKDYTYSSNFDVPLTVWNDLETFNTTNLFSYIHDGITIFPGSRYKSVGGVGDVYERDKSLENLGLTGVGVGTKAGDVPIDWAGYGDLVETLEGVRAGTLDIAGVLADSKVYVYDTTRDTVIDSDGTLDNDLPVADVVPGAKVSDYTIMGLQNVFPFCIPFDLIDFLNVLDAEPEAPRFQWEFEYMNGQKYTIDIDLSRFESVAAMFRKFECLAFCLALIMITRDKMIKG